MKIRNICLVDTPYALLLFLLKMPMEEILHTKFITGFYLNKSITRKLPNNCVTFLIAFVEVDPKQLMKVRLTKLFKMSYIYAADIYAQDHLPFSAQIIGRRKYTLIADSPHYLTIQEGMISQPFEYIMPKATVKTYIKSFLAYYGTMYGRKYGTNNQCVNRWITTKDDLMTRYVKNRLCEYMDTEEMWQNSTQEKKDFIMQVFNITSSVLEQCRQCTSILLTQPFQEDCGLTDNEYIDIYKPIISKYEHLIIKPHPREKFDFETHFPNAFVLRTYAPMQLLSYIGIVPKIGITVCSTAISALPETTKKVILGSRIHPKILATYGDYGDGTLNK